MSITCSLTQYTFLQRKRKKIAHNTNYSSDTSMYQGKWLMCDIVTSLDKKSIPLVSVGRDTCVYTITKPLAIGSTVWQNRIWLNTR